MTTIQPAATTSCRSIGPAGTTARAVVGIALVADVAWGQTHSPSGIRPASWALGLLAFPAVLVAAQAWRARRTPTRLQATGPVGHTANLLVFLALWLTPYYAPALAVTSDAALVFYGTSMLLAAYRGYAGCEVLAISNWLLRRDDQVGCVLFFPLDYIEQRQRGG